eukprot:3553222-Rhodomonas_salina.2
MPWSCCIVRGSRKTEPAKKLEVDCSAYLHACSAIPGPDTASASAGGEALGAMLGKCKSLCALSLEVPTVCAATAYARATRCPVLTIRVLYDARYSLAAVAPLSAYVPAGTP